MSSIAIAFSAMTAFGGQAENNKLNSIECAKTLAQRGIVETVYGLDIKFFEEVSDLTDGRFIGSTATKTDKRTIRGIEFKVSYDPKTDIAQATASLKLSRIADLVDKDKINFDKCGDMVISRVAFASSTPENARKLGALRAAEIDAYRNMFKQICGFTLESQTKVENFILKSDKVKAQVTGSLMGAEFVGFAWEGEAKDPIAVVKMRLNIKELTKMLGERIINYDLDVVESEGRAVPAREDQVSEAKKLKPERPTTGGVPEVVEESISVLP